MEQKIARKGEEQSKRQIITLHSKVADSCYAQHHLIIISCESFVVNFNTSVVT